MVNGEVRMGPAQMASLGDGASSGRTRGSPPTGVGRGLDWGQFQLAGIRRAPE